MEPEFRSLLYAEPHLYDVVFPDTDGSLPRMCRDALRRYMTAAPASALDIGCGTGQLLDALAETVPECWGVDLLDTNVAYARATRPRLHVVQGDMRSVRLGWTFDLVTSFGNALSYALTDDDVARTMDTYAAHAHAGRRIFAGARPAPPTRAACGVASSTPLPAGSTSGRARHRLVALRDDERDR